MTDTKPVILNIDDEELNNLIIEELLNPKYFLYNAQSGEEGLELLKQYKPDLILLDVMMPGLDGFETCRQIKSLPEGKDTPVIFLSALDELDEKLKGYEAGGFDYMTKPYLPDELLNKIEVALGTVQQLRQVQRDSQEAMSTAMTAMSSASEIGVVLRFIQESFTIDNHHDLAMALLVSIQDYGLNGAVMFKTGESFEYVSHDGQYKPLEANLLSHLKDQQRILSFKNRTTFNFPNLILLIRNMPVKDEERYGRLKDHLAILAEGANARCYALDVDRELQIQKRQLIDVIRATGKTLKSIEAKHQSHRQHNEHIMNKLGMDLEALFMELGLTEEQENILRKLIKQAEQNTNELYDEGVELDQELEVILGEFNNAIKENSLDALHAHTNNTV